MTPPSATSETATRDVATMRPRVAGDREAEILEAALEVPTDVGYDRLTMDAVALRAKASKATLYRRWNGKVSLVIEALQHGHHHDEQPDPRQLEAWCLIQVVEYGVGVTVRGELGGQCRVRGARQVRVGREEERCVRRPVGNAGPAQREATERAQERCSP